MFDRFTEKARRVVFFARYEASQYGSPYIESEHLLLGLLREDKALTNRFLGLPGTGEAIRKEIDQHTTTREKIQTSVDLPLSNENKRVLAYAAEEAERLLHQHIGTEHLLLGLLREEKCFAAKVLQDRGVRLEAVREELRGFPHQPLEHREGARQPSFRAQFTREFVHASDPLQPLVGRENELERLISILCRRTRKSPVLVGEPGVGKKTIIGGMAQRIADGTVPAMLAGKSILTLDRPSLGAIEKDPAWIKKFQTESAIFFVEDLHTPANTMPGTRSLHIEEILKPLVMSGKIECITTATPQGYARSIENHGWLEQYFQAVEVAPASEVDAIKVLLGIKDDYEKFHGVTYTEEALTYAVYYASCCIRGRALPGNAVDVIDEAGAGLGMHHPALPQEVAELRKRVKFIVHRMEGAVANHELEKASFYSDEERKERENLRLLREKYKLDETVTSTVTREHIENVVSRWTGATIASIRQALANSKKPRP
jgi:ATP-dependent Clp protease ATP-binding subunit ClpC